MSTRDTDAAAEAHGTTASRIGDGKGAAFAGRRPTEWERKDVAFMDGWIDATIVLARERAGNAERLRKIAAEREDEKRNGAIVGSAAIQIRTALESAIPICKMAKSGKPNPREQRQIADTGAAIDAAISAIKHAEEMVAAAIAKSEAEVAAKADKKPKTKQARACAKA